MWIRLFSKFGVLCLPISTSAYTVHTEALTTGMFNEEVIERLLFLFDKVDKINILDSKTFAKSKSNFFHQFILAGTYRRLGQRDLAEAEKIMEFIQS